MKNKIRILCIDDDVQIRFALSALCESQGWYPEVASNVKEALRIFSEGYIDLILIDYHLPGINGIEGVRMLRMRSQTVPIIVFTIDDNQEVADSFLKAGASDFALKPIKALDMISRIKLHIRLMESMSEEKGSRIERKGISQATNELIMNYLDEVSEPKTAAEIAEATGLANQTSYRYLQYLIEDGKVITETSYGRVGRPKQKFLASKPTKSWHFLKKYEEADTEEKILILYNAIGVLAGYENMTEYVNKIFGAGCAERFLKSVKAVKSMQEDLDGGTETGEVLLDRNEIDDLKMMFEDVLKKM